MMTDIVYKAIGLHKPFSNLLKYVETLQCSLTRSKCKDSEDRKVNNFTN